MKKSPAPSFSANKSRRSLKEYAVISAKGFCMGAADVVPGVSGGTMAFILGIYRELLDSIRSFDAPLLGLVLKRRFGEALQRARWEFLLALGMGIIAAILTLAKGISWMLANQPVLIWSFFFGLVLSSAYTVSRHLEKMTPSLVLFLVGGGVFTFFLVGMVPAQTPETWWFLFASGALAICAMILPGISGSFILVLLGKYEFILNAVNQRDILTIVFVGAGAAVGIVSFVRVLSWLFSRWHDIIIAVLTGFMLGSLRRVWPWKDGNGGNLLPASLDAEFFSAAGLMLLGIALVLALTWAEGRKNRVDFSD
jgi:putative membrane protein